VKALEGGGRGLFKGTTRRIRIFL